MLTLKIMGVNSQITFDLTAFIVLITPFRSRFSSFSEIDIVGDIRHKGMLMGIELVTNKKKKTPIHPKRSINKIFFEEGKKQGIYLRTLGNIVMLVPPLSISEKELNLLLNGVIRTIKAVRSKVI